MSYDVLNWNEIQSKKLNVYLMLLFFSDNTPQS